MKKLSLLAMLVAVVLVSVMTSMTLSQEQSKENMNEMPFGTQEDIRMARVLWSAIEGYQNSWHEYPGFEGFQPGNSPHGEWLKYYVNTTAKENLKELPYGSIIIKENYGVKDEKKLGPITVMVRLEGYDSENYDWYYVKYNPDGRLDTNPKGMKLAGAVAKGMDSGCIACHASADGDDYVFANDE